MELMALALAPIAVLAVFYFIRDRYEKEPKLFWRWGFFGAFVWRDLFWLWMCMLLLPMRRGYRRFCFRQPMKKGSSGFVLRR